MMATYSPHQESKSPIHLKSPAHVAHFDPHSAIREIRRSLSRSPSKGSELRQYSFRTFSPCAAAIPFSPSPLSPSRRSTSDNYLQVSAPSSPYVSRNLQPSRLHRQPLRRSAQTLNVVRGRTSPNSPSKRVLTDSSDSGNSSPMPVRKRNSAESHPKLVIPPMDLTVDKENSPPTGEGSAGWKSTQTTKQEKRRSVGSLMSSVAPISPMKRTDGPMNLDLPDFQSPSTKRRSLHGPILDFSIFESQSLNETRSQDDNDWLRHGSTLSSSRFSTIPKRSSSLRKSTIQQRQLERPSQLKLSQVADLDGSWFDATPAVNGKKEFRMSLDNHLDPLPRESPFSSQGNLLSASIHPVGATQNSQIPQQRHPLSRTITQSSSASSFQDDSPTHEPIHRPIRPRSYDFSKSLPIGAARPSPSLDGNEYSSQGSFATPGNYKSAKPLPAAFMSTGLISKKNRNAEEPNGGLPKAHMPDTPCKKQPAIFPAENKFGTFNPVPGKIPSQSFGTPSTPLEVSQNSTRATPVAFVKNMGIFGIRSNRHSLVRKTSFASIEIDEKRLSQSPTSRGDSQSTDADYPPTPTKHVIDNAGRTTSKSPSPHTGGIPSHNFATSISGPRFTSSKLSPIGASPGSVDGDSDSVMEDSPSANLRPKSALRIVSMPGSSFTQGRAFKNLNSPTPLSRQALAISTIHPRDLERTKKTSLSPVSPRIEEIDHVLPQTPQEGLFPPDPSGLSISGRGERPATRGGNSNGSFIPATPTGPREYFPSFSNRPTLNLASNEASDVDHSLMARFQRVDLVGTGEFSQVYRASQPPETSPYHKVYTVSTTSRPSPKGSIPERVWAVKKSRYPYTGARDRQHKIHEVDVLKALGHSDHVLGFVDSWEDQGHLYIQTEFCEEGTLDVFLAQVGLKARLDDFRIWKILLELSLGLKHIHESGYIHLDLKPANILITFEGVLKIADFGMATNWPAKAGIEGEGDREYIGPEVLMGKYDKPADIFALGLIMLETAGNVELPDNGLSWQKLRNGDMSDVPSLTWSSETSTLFRDSSGNPLSEPGSSQDSETVFEPSSQSNGNDRIEPSVQQTQYNSQQLARSGELFHPPTFMIDPSHTSALDRVVRWMISPEPADRPLANELLYTEGVIWAESRRRAGASIFEGNWGPADEVLAEDAEMIDV